MKNSMVRPIETMKEKAWEIFLIEDNPFYLKLLQDSLRIQLKVNNLPNYIRTFPNGETMLANMDSTPDVVIVDYFLDGNDEKAMNGLELMRKVKAIDPSTPVIILSQQQEDPSLVSQALRENAYSYVFKSEESHLELTKLIKKIAKEKQPQHSYEKKGMMSFFKKMLG